MKLNKFYAMIFLICTTYKTYPKVNPARVQGWIELNTIKKKAQAIAQKYELLQTQLEQETTTVLENYIQEADQVAQADPLAALYMYHQMEDITTKTDEQCMNMQQTKEKYNQLAAYVQAQIQELAYIRRKHLQFP